MTTHVNLINNTVLSFVANISNLFLLLLLFIAGRQLTVSDFGTLSYGLALGATLALLADFGLNDLTRRTVARDPSKGSLYLNNLTTLKILGAAIAITFASILTFYTHEDKSLYLAVILLVVGGILKAFKTLLLNLFQAAERFDLSTLSQVFHNIGLLTTCSIVLFSGGGLVIFASAYVCFKIFDLLLAYILMHIKLFNFSFKWDLNFQRSVQLAAIPFGAFMIVQEVYWYGDTLMLMYLKGSEAVGYYNAAYRILDGLFVFPNIICQAIGPQLARLFHQSPPQHYQLTIQTGKYSAVLATLITGSGIILGPILLPALFGKNYTASIPIFQILMAGYLFLFLNVFILNILISIDQQRLLWRLSLGGLILNLTANLFVIPTWGPEGAALTTVFSEITVLLIGLIMLRDKLSIRPLVVSLCKSAVAGGLTLIMVYYLIASSPVINLAAFIAGTIAISVTLKLISYNDFRSIISKQKHHN